MASETKLALDGYDAVAYQTESTARLGSPEHETEWNGSRWRFASAENQKAFLASPQRYAPQYDGNCAFAVSFGGKAPTSPKAWRVLDGRLFLYANGVVRAISGLFPGRIRAADAKWQVR